MIKYHCENHKRVHADSMREAAGVFAERKAKAEFGRGAQVGALNQSSCR